MEAKNPNKKVIAVLPAYNAAKTVEKTVNDISREWVDEIILVDDASRDNTVEIAKKLGLKTFVHPKNRGYGGNQKTCYKEALAAGADIAVMVHPDHQYDPKLVPELLKPILAGEADAVFGSRMMFPKNALAGGMPYWKFLANIFLTFIENLFLGLSLTEYHSGFRAYGRQVLEAVPLEKNSDDFVFDTEIIAQIKVAGLKIKEVPIATRYFSEASQIGLLKSIKYGLSVLSVMKKYIFFRLGIKKYEQFKINQN
ncbi:MAG TPA: glycosyltransferase family 2 protein [Candidatus Portnoybacteria bacterium]|nr:glycosyltransferase family 2 protein [Candidatus Portnoybacteria bacterium]